MQTLHSVARERVRKDDAAKRKQAAKAEKAKQRAAMRAEKRERKRGAWSAIGHALNAFGVVGAVGFAAAFNLAMFPEAMAQEPHVVTALHMVAAAPIAQAAASQLDTTPVGAPAAAPDPDEVHLLAATTWAEARSEGETGMRAVAHVIVNRVGRRFGGDLREVVLSPKQFSSWNLHDPNRPLAQHPERYATAGANRETWETAQTVAREVLEGKSKDPTGGALFYHTRTTHPWWSRFGVNAQTIGAHVFYSDVPDRRGRG